MTEPTNEQISVAHEAAKAQMTPETFNFEDAVQDRNYPEFNVEIYLDEKAVQKFMDVHDKRVILEEKIKNRKDRGAQDSAQYAEDLEALDYEYLEITEALKDKMYMVHIVGISPEASMALEAVANEAFPIEYDTVVSPITGAPTKTEIENDKRDEYYVNLLRQAHIKSITAPNGAVDADFSDMDKLTRIIRKLPFLARNRIDAAINNATITADFYRVLVDPVF